MSAPYNVPDPTTEALAERALELAAKCDGSSMNAGKPIAGIHPLFTETTETLRALAARLRETETELHEARQFMSSREARLESRLDEAQARLRETVELLVDIETEKIERGTKILRLCKALETVCQYVSWCNHGEMDRGEALDKIDKLASGALAVLLGGGE